jgi:hypothetical protein
MTCSFSFKKEVKVYVAYPADAALPDIYQIDISEINASQTFMEHSYSNKTIQAQNMFEQSVINKANSANFDLTLPAIRESDFKILFERSLDYAAFDLYIVTDNDVIRVRNCVITNCAFVLEKLRPLSLSISGEASQVISLPGGTEIVGTLQPRSSTMTYNRLSALEVTLNSVNVTEEALASITLELQNEVNWTPYTTVNKALVVEDADNSMYPESFTIGKRILAGTMSQYLTEVNVASLFDWKTSSPLLIRVGQYVDTTLYGFIISLDTCAFTNRLNTGEVFTHSYDWRLTQNNKPLSEIVVYNVS